MERVRTLTPFSQSLVHLDQPDHSDSPQSTGHLNCLHFLTRSKGGQLMPAAFGATTMSRAIVFMPLHHS